MKRVSAKGLPLLVSASAVAFGQIRSRYGWKARGCSWRGTTDVGSSGYEFTAGYKTVTMAGEGFFSLPIDMERRIYWITSTARQEKRARPGGEALALL